MDLHRSSAEGLREKVQIWWHAAMCITLFYEPSQSATEIGEGGRQRRTSRTHSKTERTVDPSSSCAHWSKLQELRERKAYQSEGRFQK